MRKKSPSLTTACFLCWSSLALLGSLPLLGQGTAHAADMDSIKEKIGSILNKGKDKASDLLEKGGQMGKDLLEEGKVLRDDAVRKGDELLDSLDKSLDSKPKEPTKNDDKSGDEDAVPATPVQNVADNPAADKAATDKAATDKAATNTTDKPAASPAAVSDAPK